MISVAVIVVSDRASKDPTYDKCTEAISRWILDKHPSWRIGYSKIIPDVHQDIQAAVMAAVDGNRCDFIVTSGGTGFGIRDITPEVPNPLVFGAHILFLGGGAIVAAGGVRPVAGVIRASLVVTMPGSPRAVVENLDILDRHGLTHALDLLRGGSGKDVHSDMQQGSQNSCRCSSKAQGDTAALDMGRASKFPMLDVDEAMRLMLETCAPTFETESLPVDNVDRHILSETVYSRADLPAFASSFVDGYAILGPATPGQQFQVLTSITAGAFKSSDQEAAELREGCAVRINTGSQLPRNTQTIVMVEDTRVISSSVDREVELIEMTQATPRGLNIRAAANDLHVDQEIYSKGDLVTFQDLSILKSAGVSTVKIFQKPRIAVLSTGNELIDSGAVSASGLAMGMVLDTNRPDILNLLRRHGFVDVLDLGIVADSRELLRDTLRDALRRADVVITSGGVSMGQHDYIKQILTEDLGATIHFGRVNMKPGKPLTFATLSIQQGESHGNGTTPERKKYVFGLPGNPVSTLVTCFLFVLPLLKKLSGQSTDLQPLVVSATLEETVLLDGRPQYIRATLKNVAETLVACPTGGSQVSSRLLSMKGANALLKIPANSSGGLTAIQKGSKVDAILLQ